VTTGLTIGAVAARTSVSVPVLRAWEVRYGFPRPDRAASGHRRYSERDVESILRVVRERQAGLSLEAAIERVRRADDEPQPSIFAGLRRDRSDLPVHLLPKRSMLAISHAIEDECCARAERPVLLASFQRTRYYRGAAPRWDDLARTAAKVVVFADFAAPGVGAGGIVEVPITEEAPLRREWALVCDAPGAAAVLTGWERPGQDGVAESRRVFEAVWSAEPSIVRRATHLGLALARRRSPGLAALDGVEDLLADHPDASTAPEEVVRRATALTNRVIAYMDGSARRGLDFDFDFDFSARPGPRPSSRRPG
jgi:MerR family transcriptional regulator, light-induced transcriptional regulator